MSTYQNKNEETFLSLVDFLKGLDDRIKNLEEKQGNLNIEKIIDESMKNFVDKLKPYGFSETKKKDRGISVVSNGKEVMHLSKGEIIVKDAEVNNELKIQIKPVVVGLDELETRIAILQDSLDIINTTGSNNESKVKIIAELTETKDIKRIAKEIQKQLENLKLEFRL